MTVNLTSALTPACTPTLVKTQRMPVSARLEKDASVHHHCFCEQSANLFTTVTNSNIGTQDISYDFECSCDTASRANSNPQIHNLSGKTRKEFMRSITKDQAGMVYTSASWRVGTVRPHREPRIANHRGERASQSQPAGRHCLRLPVTSPCSRPQANSRCPLSG